MYNSILKKNQPEIHVFGFFPGLQNLDVFS